MTNEQMQNLLKILMANYRNYYKDYSQQDITIVKNTWMLLLKGFDYESVYNAILQHIADGNPFPPNAGDVINRLTKRTVSKDEAYNSFEHVIHLIGKYGSWNYTKALSEMSQVEKQIMTKSYYDQLCNSENLDVPRSQYRDYYMAVAEKHQKEPEKIEGREVKKLTWEEL
jgi:hypothetical protein